MTSKQTVDYLQDSLNKGNVVCLTGEGVSAESGIPAFRDKGSLWEKYRPEIYATTMGLVSTFETEPEEIMDFLSDFYPFLIKAKPNLTHIALATMEREGILKALITQNIDGLHQRAGSRSVIELRGNAYRVRCIRCLKTITWERDRIEEMVKLLKMYRSSRMRLLKVLSRYFPRCECGGRFRIDIVLFGERILEGELSQAHRVLEDCRLLLLIGTSLIVRTEAALPEYAKERGATIVEISSEPTNPSYDLWIPGNAGKILSGISKTL